MPNWFKTILGLLLLPVVIGAALTLHRVVKTAGDAFNVWVPFGAGIVCWLVIFLMLPKQTWLYVIGHELTHVVWGWLFGAKVKKFKASSRGGRVVLTRSNFLVVLAPYFFPLYAIIVVALFLVGNLMWNWAKYVAVFHVLLGAAYAFHVTWTWQILRTRQSDITSQGYFFSGIVIFLGNLVMLVFGISLLAGKPGLLQLFGWWWTETLTIIDAVPAIWR